MQACGTGGKKKLGFPAESVSVLPSSNINSQSGINSSPDLYGPPEVQPQQSYGPEPIKVRPVVLVFGPGLARGFAYVGVLRALMEARIPIGAIYSTEMGSLVASLYVLSANMNQFEWGLQKFKEDDFREKPSFLFRKKEQPSEGVKLETHLKSIFGNKDLSQSKIPMRIAIQSKDTGMPIILERGNVVKALRAALAAPSLFTPGIWSSGGVDVLAISAASTRPFLVTEARRFGVGPVIVVDVLNDQEAAIALDELKEADLVIKPDVKGIGYLDFQKRSVSAFRGKSAIVQNLSEIFRLVGMPESESDKRSGIQ